MLLSKEFVAYRTFLALKLHFNTTYNYSKYGGNLKSVIDNLFRNPHSHYYQKLAKHKDMEGYCIAHFVAKDITFIGDLFQEDSEQLYAEWAKRQESITYHFQQELKKLKWPIEQNFEGPRPYILRLYEQGQLSPEAFCILDYLYDVFGKLQVDDTIVYPKIRRRIRKYAYLLDADKESLKETFRKWLENGG